jgi:hypothetical protein
MIDPDHLVRVVNQVIDNLDIDTINVRKTQIKKPSQLRFETAFSDRNVIYSPTISKSISTLTSLWSFMTAL